MSQIIQALLDCGSADVQFIDEELSAFNVSAEDVIDDISMLRIEDLDANLLIHSIYWKSVRNSADDLDLDWDELSGNVSTFINFIDSHLWIQDKDGESHEMHDYEQMISFLKKNYTKQ